MNERVIEQPRNIEAALSGYGTPIEAVVDEAYRNSKAKGFHDQGDDATFGDRIALMHSELSEALEEYRNGIPVGRVYFEGGPGGSPLDWEYGITPTSEKPKGIPIELADVVIRIADFCGKHGIDLARAVKIKMAFNTTRPTRHGGKRL